MLVRFRSIFQGILPPGYSYSNGNSAP
jgi:hypothetical protein